MISNILKKFAANSQDIAEMRRELASAERALNELAVLAAERLARDERAAWLEARNACHFFDLIRPRAEARLAAIRAGVVLPGKQTAERFAGEERLAQMTLREADFADAAYTVISFARLPDRLRYLRGCARGGATVGVSGGAQDDARYDRDSLLLETLQRGGVYNDRNYFHEVVTTNTLSF